jgi:hypothetical protein
MILVMPSMSSSISTYVRLPDAVALDQQSLSVILGDIVSEQTTYVNDTHMVVPDGAAMLPFPRQCNVSLSDQPKAFRYSIYIPPSVHSPD